MPIAINWCNCYFNASPVRTIPTCIKPERLEIPVMSQCTSRGDFRGEQSPNLLIHFVFGAQNIARFNCLLSSSPTSSSSSSSGANPIRNCHRQPRFGCLCEPQFIPHFQLIVIVLSLLRRRILHIYRPQFLFFSAYL